MPRRLNNWLSSYMQYTTHTEAPDVFHFWTGVWTIAACLRQKVFFSMGHFTWTPSFYIIFVSPPGIVNKSTTASIGSKLLRDIPGIHLGPNAITWQALIGELENSTEAVELEPGLFINHSCLSFSASELGSLINLQDRQMVTVMTDLWDGHHESWRKVTKHSGDNTVERPWLNIIACTTPDWIADNMPQSIIGGGFTSRCIFVYAQRKRMLIAYPELEYADSTNWKLCDPLMHDLEVIAQMKGQFRLTAEAFTFGKEWYRLHYEHEAASMKLKEFGGYMARKQCHVHKLAMVISASRSDEMVITLDDLDAAVKIVTALEGDLPKVFGAIQASPEAGRNDRLATIIRTYKRLTKATLYRMVMSQFPSSREFDDAINGLLMAGLVAMQQHGMNIVVVATDRLLAEEAEKKPGEEEAVG